jgi:FdhD protein
VLLELPDKLRHAQAAFTRSGGLHAAGIFSRNGELIVVREDVGRHNAVDKVIGHGLLKGLLPFSEHILMVSGRASFEITQKALAARIPVVAAVSAPSSLAVDFAAEGGQTLIGFLRGQRMNLYAGAQRVK